VDENQSGRASNLHLAEVRWGRLVDVHQVDDTSKRVETPVFPDFVIEPGILSNGTDYVLDRNPVTQRERLTILDQKGLDGNDDPAFEDPFSRLLREANDALPMVAIKDDDGSSPPPFTAVPRNACMVLRLDDCLDDDATATRNLVNTVKVFTGYPPVTPFSARVVFDPNHGAVVGGSFHSTRVLVDMTTSQVEASAPGSPPLEVNPVGLPASLTTSTATNVSVRLPTRVDPGSAQFQVLTNLSGVALEFEGNGPVDQNSVTLDVVRAVRSGNSADLSNGFLTDVERPRVLGGWPVSVTRQVANAAGDPDFDFLIDLTFTSDCRNDIAVGDVITVGGAFLQVSAAQPLVGAGVINLAVRSVFALVPDGDPLTDDVLPEDLVGSGIFQAPFHPSLLDPPVALARGCWVTFVPDAAAPPVTGVSTTTQIAVRFSEPMDPGSLSPFGQFLVVSGPASPGGASTATSNNIIVGGVLPNSDLTLFSYEPRSPLPHVSGMAETLHVELGEARDLAGNRLRHLLPFVDFTIDPPQLPQRNDALVLRFDANDEYAPNGGNTDSRLDLRGQFFYDGVRGAIIPRPVSLTGWPVDRTNLVPGVMFNPGGGVFLPLNPLGTKLQMLWRYCDLGWQVLDETKFNVDVFGLSWSPIGGLVVSDFYDQFEMRLGHSRFLPDEACCGGAGGNSGLPGGPAFFEGNYLAGSNQKVVHNRALGYTVNAANLFTAPTGTPMMPFPLNRGLSPPVTYTWRDTTILTLGADGETAPMTGQPGIPLAAEVVAQVPNLPGGAGSVARAGMVPSFGLPLLIELKCFPSERGLGLNQFGVNIAVFGFATPSFRAYSAGGINTLGNPVIVLPDSETFPAGGFNPFSAPPGLRTALSAESIFYLGQVDTVVRVSRAHSVWLDAGQDAVPLWKVPVFEPSPAEQPSGTGVVLDYRSATGFAGTSADTAPFDATAMNAYGQLPPMAAAPQSLTDWSSNISIGNLQRYLQLRITFVNNITSGATPELRALGLPYDLQ
jgi:hypothetical protein